MAKRKKGPPRERQQILSQGQINMTKEANYIIERAQESDTRIVSIGSLVFFSTETGDAWILDPSESLALCLARAGERQTFDIIETPTQFAVDWQANFQIEDDQFIVFEKDGQTRAIMGYPIRELKRYIRRTLRSKQR
ncbi:MAG: hypothetical protein GY797_06935 [Deltaproteobacteria bacterium]|nr:hypothetical protein [Deltaproteobacteria bacterium]